jgi:hypothetical protein
MISPIMQPAGLSNGRETMDALFYYVLNMNMAAALIGLPSCVLRRIRQGPRFLVHLSWSFVGIRLLLPFAFSSRISLLSAGGRLVKRLVPLPGETGPAGLKLKRRITAVMNGMRHPLPIILLLALFFVILGVSLLSNPMMPFHPVSGSLPVVEVQNALSSYYRPPFQPAEGVTEAQAKTLCLSWLQQHGYGELMEDSLQISDCTREEGWNNEKLQMFAVSGFGWDSGVVIFQNGKVLSVLSGMPLEFSWLADLDADGLYEFYGNAMFGSGVVNMEVIGFNPSNGNLYRLSNRMKEDYRLYVRDGMLVVDVMPYSPAGPGSSDERVTRRLVLDRGKLALTQVDPQ